MKHIELTKGKIAIVDDDDYEILSKWKWHICAAGYASRKQKSYEVTTTRKQIYMHRVINGTEDGFFTDHINGNKLDNRKENLRSVTTSENLRNKKMPKNNKTGFKGVFNMGEKYMNRPWRAAIRIDGKTVFLGYFETSLHAAVAYDKSAKENFGEFARLNNV